MCLKLGSNEKIHEFLGYRILTLHWTMRIIALSKHLTDADGILIPDSNHFDLYLEDWELTIGPVRFG